MRKENRENLRQADVISVESVRVMFDAIRSATKVVKVFPFIYVVILLLILPINAYCRAEFALYIGMMFYISVLFVALLIRLSYCFKLCKWHRLQCCLPLVPQITDYIDANIYEFDVSLATLNWVLYFGIFSISLINAYHVFIKQSKFPIFSCRG